MSSNETKSLDYQPLASPVKKRGAESGDQAALKPSGRLNEREDDFSTKREEDFSTKSLTNSSRQAEKIETQPEPTPVSNETALAGNFVPGAESAAAEKETVYLSEQKRKKEIKKINKDRKLLTGDNWLERNGHNLTFVGLYLFSILVLFRPYELVNSLSFLSATAFYFAVATLAVFIPTQLSAEGTLTTFPTEVKCILALTLLAIVTMPIAKDPRIAWGTFNDTFIKAVLMFVVMVNVVRTRLRLMTLIWLSLFIGIYLSYMALNLYMKGETKAEGYRVMVEIGGMFGNPNDMALHLVMMLPLAVVLGIASKKKAVRFFYFVVAGLLITANTVTFSRGGFIGLIATSSVLVWKLGRRQRLKVTLISVVASALFILVAPGNYGLRLLSIFIPGLDPVGSSNQRQELLKRGIYVTIRNPWGIGMGNSLLMNDFNLQWHNAYVQVASELSLFGLVAYLIFLISPFRKLGAIERKLFAENDCNWFYYMAIGLQASLIGFMFSSFFGSVAYNWYIYYLVAYAVAFRRIYQIENGLNREIEPDSFEKFGKNVFGWHSA